MATRKENEQKKELARLYFMQGEDQKTIAAKVGVSETTLSRWATAGAWTEKRAGINITRPEIVNKNLVLIAKLLDKLNSEDVSLVDVGRIVDQISKLAAAIERIDKKVSAVDAIEVFTAMNKWLESRLVWDKNIRGENGRLMRLVGGMPVPVGDVHAATALLGDVHGLLCAGGWLHVYAEGSMWEFYRPVRPFKSGLAYLACRENKPVLPMAFSYRKPGFIREKIFRQTTLFTLTVGEPLFPDPALPRKAREEDLTKRCHEAVCSLAGIEPGENLYPPVFRDSRRVDYYDAPNNEKMP